MQSMSKKSKANINNLQKMIKKNYRKFLVLKTTESSL